MGRQLIKNNDRDDEFLQVTSARGEIVVKVRIDNKVPRGTAFMAFHWREVPANVLTNEAVDPTARIPEYKVNSIRVKKIEAKNTATIISQ